MRRPPTGDLGKDLRSMGIEFVHTRSQVAERDMAQMSAATNSGQSPVTAMLNKRGTTVLYCQLFYARQATVL